jgi:hypothetical protein
MNRRRAIVIVMLAPACALSAEPDAGQALSLLDRVNVLKDLVDAIGAAGDAISKLTDGVAHLVTTGQHGYDFVDARVERQRLIDISAQSDILISRNQEPAVQALDAYLLKKDPTAADWDDVLQHLRTTLQKTRDLLVALETDRSDFVLQPAFAELESALSEKTSIFERLAILPPPSDVQERKLLREASKRYKRPVQKSL